MNQDIFQSKLLIISVIFLFILLISSDVLPQRNVSVQRDVDRLIREGKELYKNGEYREAIVKFLEAKDLARTREEISEVYFNLSSAYYASNQSVEAKEHLQKSLEILPERTINALYYSADFVEMFNETKAESIKLKEKEKRPIVKAKPAVEKKVKKGGGGILIVLGLLVIGGGAAALLLGGKSSDGGDSGNGTPAPVYGSIQVSSSPTGAQVFLDGSDTGRTTNTTLTDVSPGSHTVDLVMEGYEDEQASVSVTAGQTAQVSVTLTEPTITVLELPAGTVWRTGEGVEIKWGVSGSGASQAVVSSGAGLDPSIHQGGRALSPFQRRGIQQRRFLRSEIKERRRAADVDSSGNRGMLSSNTSEPQGVSGEATSSVKEDDIVDKRARDIREIKRNSRVGIVNIPVAPQVSTEKFAQSGDIRVLGLSNVKIDLYKGSTFNQTIVSSTENDGSYLWTVDQSLEDGADYKVRILSTSDSSMYGESDAFEINSVDISEAVDNSDLAWSTSGDADWFGQTNSYYYDGDALQSGAVSDSQLSYVQTTVTGGPGSLKFYWKVSSENTFDNLTFYVDGAEVPGYQISGEVDWEQKTYSIDEGSHLVKWEYKKDATVGAGSDCGWLDKVELIPDNTITIINPTSSTTWTPGNPADITWSSTGTISNVKIDLYKGTTFEETIISSIANDGTYTWATVNSTLADGTDYKVRVSSTTDSGIYGESDAFMIGDISITVTEPINSTSWTKGQSADITWTSTGTISDVKIDLYKGGTFNQTIVSTTVNNGSYTWTEVDTSLVDGTDYKVRISSTSNSSVYGESDEFQITSLSISDAVDNFDLTWSTGGDADWFGQTASYYYDGDAAQSGAVSDSQLSYVQTTITRGPGSLNFYWKVSSENTFDELTFYVDGVAVPGYQISGEVDWEQKTYSIGAGSYLVKWEYAKDSSISSGSDCGWLDKVELIMNPITITNPTSSTHWTQGYTADIAWTSTGTINNVKIDLYKGSTLNTTIASDTINDGSHSWTVDSSLSMGSDYKVRISSTVDSGLYGESATFQVSHDYEYVTKWGSQGGQDGQFSSPTRLAVDNSGYVYVADSMNERIQKFTSDGTFVTKWGGNGTGNSQFNNPQGIAVDSSGYVYVTDSGNDRIQKFTSDGAYVSQWGSYGSGDGQLNNPMGIAVDDLGYVYVADTDNNRIQKFTTNGLYVIQWGSPGTASGQFYQLRDIDVDNLRYVYTVEEGNDRVQKFTSDGTFVTQWGSFGSGNGQFIWPEGIAVDNDGFVYVSDFLDVIKKHESGGAYVTSWGSSGSGDGQFNTPLGIAVDSSGNVYVADKFNHRIQKFQLISAGAGSLQLNLNNSRIINNNFNTIKSSKTKSNKIKSTLTRRLK